MDPGTHAYFMQGVIRLAACDLLGLYFGSAAATALHQLDEGIKRFQLEIWEPVLVGVSWSQLGSVATAGGINRLQGMAKTVVCGQLKSTGFGRLV